jgi:tetratricopeptide (TPR) repeat protein
MGTHGNEPVDPVQSSVFLSGFPTARSNNEPAVADDLLRFGAARAGRYQLLEEIARGGMGVVHRARDTALGREVAVKVLRDEFAPGSAAARRFVDEARITGQLQHPGIPPLHDVGIGADGRPFLAMKLIKGRTLEELLRARPEPDAERGRFVAAFEQICQAVAFAHAHQVIHRDLKPENIMVGSFGEVQVMDWGLAKVLTAPQAEGMSADQTPATEIRSLRELDGPETQAGSVLGTPAFMPPEQAVGAVEQIDEQSDVFGLGAILAVILTGSPPFVGDTAESTRVLAARGKVEDCYRRLGACGAEPELIALCKRCLSPEKADRPRDAGEVARAVAGLRAAADERARRAELDRVRAEGERAKAEAEAREQRKRRRTQVALAMAVLAAVGLLGFGLWWELQRAANQKREQGAARARARDQLQEVLHGVALDLGADRLDKVDAALDRAADLLGAAASPQLQMQYNHLRADRSTVAQLDRVWAKASAILDERVPGTARRAGGLHFDEEAARAGYPAAFAVFGLTGSGADPAATAALIGHSAIRDRLIAALDDWLPFALPGDRPCLCEVLARLDPNAARNEVRHAHTEPDQLRTLFARPPAAEALRVAARAALVPTVPDAHALPVLRAATVLHPNDFRIQYALGARTLRANPAKAVGHFRAAMSLRPDNLAAVFGLGLALHQAREPGEAAPYYLRAIEIDPGFGSAYLNLADAIKLGADPAPAIAYFEKEISRNERSAMAQFGLGMALRDQNHNKAAAAFRKSLALDDTFAMAHNYLGNVLDGRANIEERIRCYRRAIELDPTFAFPHYNLANVLRRTGDPRGAVDEFEKALQLFPEHTFSHLDLGLTLAELKDWQGAVRHLRRVIEINPYFQEAYPHLGRILIWKTNDLPGAVDLFRSCVQRFPTWHEGYDGLVVALIRKGAPAEAVRVYYEAVRGEHRNWPEVVRRRLRYNAACGAVRAGAGAGEDAPPQADRVAFRQQALDWLRTELDSYRKSFDANPTASQAAVAEAMKTWLADSDLTSVREPAAIEQLPATEQGAWSQLWGDVRKLLTDSAAPPK